jgi:hypothetical protein
MGRELNTAKAGIHKSLLDEVGAGRAPFGALAKNCSGFMALVGRRVSRCGYSQTPVGTVGVGAIPLGVAVNSVTNPLPRSGICPKVKFLGVAHASSTARGVSCSRDPAGKSKF